MSPKYIMGKDAQENDSCLEDGNRLKEGPDRDKVNRCHKLIIGFLVLIALILLIVVIILLSVPCSPPPQPSRLLCDSPDCYGTSSAILRQSNSSIEPCDDFYSFACGGWLRDHPIPPQYGGVSVGSNARRAFADRSRTIIETMPYTANFQTLQWKLKSFYHSCMDLDTVDSLGDTFLKNHIELLKGWKPLTSWVPGSWDWAKVLRSLHGEMGVFPFFSISVKPDDVNPIQNAILISPSGLGLPHASYYFHVADDKVILAYRQLMKDLAQNLGATSLLSQSFADEIFHFEKRIAEKILLLESTNDSVVEKVTIKELRAISQRIKWIDHLKAFFTNAYISENTPVYTTSKQYLTDVSTILSTTDMGSLNSYLIWTLVFKYAPYLSEKYRTAYDTYLRVFTGAPEPQPRWEFCIEATNEVFNLALVSYYVHQTIPEEKFHIANEVYKNVRDAFVHTLRNVDWMESHTKNLVVDKIKTIYPKVAYSDFVLTDSYLDQFYSELSVLKTHFSQNIQNGALFKNKKLEDAIKNASRDYLKLNVMAGDNPYHSSLNQINIPPVMLREPFLNDDQPRYITYGNLGSYVGHGLVQGLEEVGKTFERSGFTPIMWTNVTLVAIAKYLGCLAEHHRDYKFDVNEVFKNQSLYNSFADISGIRQSYNAFMNWESQKGEERILPGVTYTTQQLFFISYAQTMCSAAREEEMQNFVKLSRYLPGRVRVLSTLSQVSEFTEAFGCGRNTLLNPDKRCQLW